MATPKRKRQAISVEIKKKVIDAAAVDPKKSYQDLANEFSNDQLKLEKTNIQRILNGKAKILTAIDDGVDAKRAKLRTPKEPDLEAAVLTWMRQIRSENVAVTGPLLKVDFNQNTFIFTGISRKRQSSWLKNWILRTSKLVMVG